MVYIFNLMQGFWNCFLKKGSKTAGKRSGGYWHHSKNNRECTYTCTEYALQNGRVTRKSLSMINPYITQPLWLRGGQYKAKIITQNKSADFCSQKDGKISSTVPEISQIYLKIYCIHWETSKARFKNQMFFSKKIHYLNFVTWEDQKHSITLKKEKKNPQITV